MAEQKNTELLPEKEKTLASGIEENISNNSNVTSEINKDTKQSKITNAPDNRKSTTNWWLIGLIYFASVSNHLPLSAGLYLKYGSPTPCGAFLNAITQSAYKEADKLSRNEWEYTGAIIGTALGRSAAEQQINSMNFWECGSALSQIEKNN